MLFETTSPAENHKNEARTLDRRKFLTLLGMAGGGMVAAAPVEAFAGLFGPSPEEICRNAGIPAEWIGRMGMPLMEYVVFLRKQPLKNIATIQIIEPHMKRHGRVENKIPPKALWSNIRSTLQVVDRVATHVNERVEEIVSAYRCPAYNATCPGGKSNSMHLRNNALDITFRTSPRSVASAAKDLRARGIFKGGIGRYSGFTHIDTRGNNADWTG